MITNNSRQVNQGIDTSLDHWYAIWFQLFFKPTQDRISELVSNYDRDRRTPLKWLFFSSAIGGSLYFIPYTISQGTFRITYLIGSPLFFGLNGVIGIGLFVVVTQFIAVKLLSGEGTTADLFYICAAIRSPAYLISRLFVLISIIYPLVMYVGTIIGLYEIILLSLATKSINKFSWTKAVIAVLPSFAIGISTKFILGI